MPKVIHLVISDLFGAGRAALRISDAVQENGWNSEVWVLNPGPLKQANVIPLSGSEKLGRMLAKTRNDLAMKSYPMNGYFHYDRYALPLSGKPFLKDADVVHLHWISEGIYSRTFLKDLKKPVVWTLHDMWSFTGGCHYTGDCRKFTARCGRCECLGSAKDSDLSTLGQTCRMQEYEGVDLQFVGCSEWMSAEANASTVLRGSGLSCITIPNPIEARWFHARDKEECRRLLSIRTDKKLILTGSINLKDPRKGCRYVLDAFRALDPEKYALCTFGNPEGMDLSGFEVISCGTVYDDLHLSLIYGACDCFCAPSVQENLANTVMESLACGVPVTAFAIGGMKDMIRSGENGYLAKPFDVSDFAEGIRQCSEKGEEREAIASDCHQRFSPVKIGKRYTEVYEKLMRRRKIQPAEDK